MEGMVMNQAFGAPEELRKLLPPKVIDMAKLPAMLRPKAARNG